MVIGLSLAGTAAKDATLNASGHYDLRYFAVALVTLIITIFFNMYLKGFMGLFYWELFLDMELPVYVD